jgi:Glycosyl hydrolase family 26
VTARCAQLVLLALMIVLAAARLAGPAAAASVTKTFSSVADSYVSQKFPSANYGSKTALRLQGTPIQRAYLRFDVQGLTLPVVRATLRLYATSGSSVGYTIRAVADTSWGEKTITYANAPALTAGSTDPPSGPFTSAQWVSVDVTQFVHGNGLASFAATSTSSTTISLASREYGASFAPQLVVETADGAASAPTSTAAPTISGRAREGQTLTVEPGGWSGTAPLTYSYQWRRCDAAGGNCVGIDGATASLHQVSRADVGTTLRCQVTATNVAGSSSASSARTDVVTSILLPASSGAYFGARVNSDGTGGWTQQEVLDFETLVGRKIAIDHHYRGWAETSWPSSTGGEQWDVDNGRIPLDSWGGSSGFPGLDAVLNGSQDAVIRSTAQRIKAFGRPLFFRPWWEMNGSWMSWCGCNSNTPGTTDGPAKFVAAWRHMHDIFDQEGATNAVWVWSPHYRDDPADSWNHWTNYYPGDAYVDWVAFDGYNRYASAWKSFSAIFQAPYDDYAAAKPFMVAETASVEDPSVPGRKAQWIQEAQTFIQSSMPAVKAFLWFHRPATASDPEDWRVDTSQTSLDAYRAMAADPYFNLSDLTPPSPPSSLTATAAASGQVDLAWAASTDNVGVTGYEVYRRLTGTVDWTKIATTGTDTTYSDSTVGGSTSYDYQVKAFDAAANLSAASNISTVVTPAGSGPPAPLSFSPDGDAQVKEAYPASNFGTLTSLRSDGGSDPDVESYLRFSLSGLSGKTLQSAKLRLYVPSDGTTDGPGVYSVSDNSWAETTVTWQARPPRAITPADDSGAIAAGTWVEWDVTPLVNGDGAYSFALGPTSTTNGVVFNSREATSNRPQLVVTFA